MNKVLFINVPFIFNKVNEAIFSIISNLKNNDIEADYFDFQDYLETKYPLVNKLRLKHGEVIYDTKEIFDKFPDINIHLEYLTNKIQIGNYTHICFNVWNVTKAFVLVVSEKIKQKTPDVKILCGGPSCTFEGYDEGKFLIDSGMVDKIFNGRFGEVELINYFIGIKYKEKNVK